MNPSPVIFPKPDEKNLAKHAAAAKALEFVKDGMTLGLGTGSTAYWFVILLAERIHKDGLKVTCATTSTQTWDLAKEYGVPVYPLDEVGVMDIVVDGADEVSSDYQLIKGGGAALLQEKIVATASEQMIVIVDSSKMVEVLGQFHLPVEVVRFGAQTTKAAIEKLLGVSDVKSAKTAFRMKGDEFLITDEGHYILDCICEEIRDPKALNLALNQIPGVVENGLFIDLADIVVVGNEGGDPKVLRRSV